MADGLPMLLAGVLEKVEGASTGELLLMGAELEQRRGLSTSTMAAAVAEVSSEDGGAAWPGTATPRRPGGEWVVGNGDRALFIA